MWLTLHQNRRYLIFHGSRSPLLGAYNNWKKLSWNSGNQPYLVANTYGLNFIKIGGIWNFLGGRSPILGGVECDQRYPFSNLAELFQSKVMCENLVLIGWACQELLWYRSKGRVSRNPLLWGLHVTCDANIQTWQSNSSQKPWVKIWFRLVEPFKSLSW